MPKTPSFILPSQRVEPYGDIEIRIQAAIESLNTNPNPYPNIAEIARKYEIPVSRLRARLQGCQSRQQRPGTNHKLTDDQELAVCQYLDRLDAIGTSARLQMVTGCANAILQYAHAGPEPAPVVSDHWAPRFLNRHSEYFIRKQISLDVNRKNAHHPDSIRTWFQKYYDICERHNIQDCDKYNFDETGFRIGIGRDQWIITRDPTRQAYLGSSTNRELVSVCETISGDGVVLPPMIIVPGIIHQESWYTTTRIPDNYLVGTSETGYNNDELTMKWLVHFEHFSAARLAGSHRLLLLDGFGSHCTKEFLDLCDLHKIIVFCLPAHSSHLLQPLDVVVFQPYKHYHAEAVEAATRTGCGDFDKAEFLDMIDTIRQQTFKSSTIESAFHATGLIPYNPDIVISKLRESVISPLQQFTPPSQSPSGIPLTIASLKTMSDELLEEGKHLPASFQAKLKLVLQGGLTLAQSGALAMEHMETTRAAEEMRNARRRGQSRRHIQKGGVIYASEARQMAKRKEDMAVEKAERDLRRARDAKKQLDTAQHKPFLDAIKEKAKAMSKRIREKERAMERERVDKEKAMAKERREKEKAIEKDRREKEKAIEKERRIKEKGKGKGRCS